MTPKLAFAQLSEKLSSIYPNREASTIARYVLEDIFKAKWPFEQTPTINTEQYTAVLQRLLQKEPWQYIVGEADFYDLKYYVDKSVLIPRPETEELVYWISQNHKTKPPQSLLDIGTGSACIPISLQKRFPTSEIWAVDKSLEALEVAKKNATRHQTPIKFLELDILSKSNWQLLPKFDIIISNPPYITTSEKQLMQTNVLDYEPHMALFVTNNDPLQFYKIILDQARQHLNPEGWVYFELNEHNGQDMVSLYKDYGYQNVELEKDLSNRDRMIRGQFI
ncbi:MAG: peptide chain release factor N(5)-glutamine methyltransferase [Aureispira sp.]|nr:peptide chain release factor N(5)-glutamine methyltransferase [Aureispira sp.]